MRKFALFLALVVAFATTVEASAAASNPTKNAGAKSHSGTIKRK